MSNYVQFFKPTPNDICKECTAEKAKEEIIARRNAAKSPVYDIDEVLDSQNRVAYEIVAELNRKIDPGSPESRLLSPELVVRDFEEFACFLGHDLGYILGRNSGPRIFLHGLRAMQAIGATAMVQYMEGVRDFAIREGVCFPDPLPDPWLCNLHIDSKMEKRLDAESRRLKKKIEPYKDMAAGALAEMVVQYLRANVELLRQRKQS